MVWLIVDNKSQTQSYASEVKKEDKSLSRANASLTHSLNTHTITLLQYPFTGTLRLPSQQYPSRGNQASLKLFPVGYQPEDKGQVGRSQCWAYGAL